MKIYMWVFCGIGIPANILTFVTISKFQFRGVASFLVCLLVVIDSVALVAKLIEMQIIAHKVSLGQFGCKTIHVPSVTLTAISNWTVILICLERYVAVCKPFKRRIWITDKRCKAAVTLISSILTVTFVSLYFIFIDIDSTGFCFVIHLTENSFYWVQFIISIAVPLIVTTVLTIAVIKTYFNARRRRLRVLIDKRNGQTDHLAERQNQTVVSSAESMEKILSLLMMSSVLLYFVINLPFCVHALVIGPLYNYNLDSFSGLINDIFFILMDSSHVLNFFLYFVFVSGFRRNVCKLFRSIC
ncbi:unnamed protein product [Lymnaea stagnalis]|uniref:G-protein coupled receptors family 1 profile domain-containing protein n=1 Tax=Lymnaea stagnalis TaxID=6523 RepID=A0AAV2IIS6_LYMST